MMLIISTKTHKRSSLLHAMITFKHPFKISELVLKASLVSRSPQITQSGFGMQESPTGLNPYFSRTPDIVCLKLFFLDEGSCPGTSPQPGGWGPLIYTNAKMLLFGVFVSLLSAKSTFSISFRSTGGEDIVPVHTNYRTVIQDSICLHQQGFR